jgi:hypothetical protein
VGGRSRLPTTSVSAVIMSRAEFPPVFRARRCAGSCS